MHWTRPALLARVESLDSRYEGDEFIRAVADFADTLDPEDVKALQDVLLKAANAKYRGQFASMDWRRRRR